MITDALMAAETMPRPFTREFTVVPNFDQTSLIAASNGVDSPGDLTTSLVNIERLMPVLYPEMEHLPYHGLEHPQHVRERARILIERCRLHGIEIDQFSVKVIEAAALLHDALAAIPPQTLGFQSAEELAAHFTFHLLIRYGVDAPTALRTAETIFGSHALCEPISIEQKILRAADLWNVGGSYPAFAEETNQLYRESLNLTGEQGSFLTFIRGSYAYLQLYLWRMIELTPEAHDSQGRSTWHMKAISNLHTLAATAIGPQEELPVRLFVFDSPAAEDVLLERYAAIDPDGPRDFRVLQAPLERQREDLLAKIREIATMGFAFVTPGASRALSIPQRFCDEVHVLDATQENLGELLRVLKPQGKLFVHQFAGNTAADFETAVTAFGAKVERREGQLRIISAPAIEDEQPKLRTSPAHTPALTTMRLPDSLRGWATALEQSPHTVWSHEFLSDLRKPMFERYRMLQEMGLIRHPLVIVDARSFLEKPDLYLAEIGGEDLFPFVESKHNRDALPKIHNRVIARDTLADAVRDTVSGYDAGEFMVTLQPAYPVLLNGNVTVGKDGAVYGEFSDGTTLPSRQRAPLLIRVWSDPYLKTFSYSSENQALRRAVQAAVQALPAEGSGRERAYQYGYYEVAVAAEPGTRGLKPLFFDYRSDRVFVE